VGDIWLVRHGATEWSATGRHTGRTDLPLTEEGRRRAAGLAPALEGRAFALVLSSPLRRARDTATLAGFPDPELDPDLREWDYGDYEGRSTPDIRREAPGWTVWTHPCPNGETADDVAARAARVIVRCDAAAGDAILFAHGHLLRVLTAIALELGPIEGRRFALDVATLNVVGREHEYRTLRRWNGEPPTAPGPGAVGSV